ncbi:hypothetical protein [Catenulispora subtropica]|uniref:ATP/GTP-binding protein n=1 Tax=Catenulispora subtropica TaxID=450798 RepID=A0ABP5EH75_9ACTN
MLTTLRRRLTAVAAVFAAVVAMTALSSPGRAAAAECQNWETDIDGTLHCTIWSSGSPGKDGGKSGYNINCTNNHITYQGKDYVCNLPDGWSFSYGCYVKTVEPQPPASDPHWGNADMSSTRMQYISCGQDPPTVPGNRPMHPGPCPNGCGGLNPVEAVTNQLAIEKPELGMAPPGGADAVGYVNANVWLWSKGLDTTTQSRQAGNVVGTRTFVRADWVVKKGDGTVAATLHCKSDHEYTADQGGAASPDPDCGYAFKNPGPYTITVTTTWSLLITQGGVASPLQTITSTPSTTTITIQEGQSNNG